MMAADEEMPGDQARPKRAPARPQRPPLTIDLAASAAPGDAVRAAGKPPVEDLADEAVSPTGPEPSVPPAEPAPPSSPPPSRRGRGWLGLLAAAFLGGIVATLIGVAGHSSGLFPSPAQKAADAATAAARRASDGLAALDGRVTTIETSVAALKADADKVAGLETSAAGLADRVAKLEAAPAVPAGPDLKPALADLTARLDRLEAAAAGGKPGDGELLSDLRGRIAALEASGQALSSRIAAIESRPAAAAPPSGEAGRAALAIAVSALRQSASAGGAFDHDLAVLEVLGVPPDALAALKPLAAKGAPKKNELVEEFPGVADHILASVADAEGGGSFFAQVGAFASSFVSVRPAKPIEGDTPQAIVSRMRDAVEHGDLQRALAERDALPKIGQEASAAWAQAAADREAIDRLVDKLAASAIPPAPAPPSQ
jgi:hypothetical protein